MKRNEKREPRSITLTDPMPEGKIRSEMVSIDFCGRRRTRRGTSLQSRLIALLMIATSFGVNSEIASAADLARGKLLYETNCSECHTKSVSERSNRTAKSVSDIRKSVIQWEGYKGYRWSDEEVEDVTQYLNGRFYKYKSSPGAANDR